MLFSSLTFLFAFLPITAIFYFVPVFEREETEFKKKNIILIISSLIFYAWGEPVYIVLMLVSIYFNYNIGRHLQFYDGFEKQKKAVLFFAVAFNLILLGIFKYAGFVAENVENIFSLSLNYKAFALPVGISFYTFQALSYVIDVYRGTVKAQDKLLPFALYICMFPQLIAGPIVQYNDVEKQLVKREISKRKISVGLLFFIRGLGKKVIFANTIGAVWSEISAQDLNSMPALTAWFGILCYTMQIYFDFSGYSDMALGLGKILGFDFIQNFNFPYTATSIKDFWKRWHISLSSWFRDYVYFSLGGNRKGSKRTIFNIAAVWCLTGLWHGASWNFVVWGAFYGALLLLEKFVFASVLEKIPLWIKHILTMVIVMVGWVFFASESMGSAALYLKAMFASSELFDTQSLYYLSSYGFILLVMALSSFGVFRDFPRFKNKELRFLLHTAEYILIFVFCVVCLVSDTYNPFLYFRF